MLAKTEPKAQKLTFDDDSMWVYLTDGRTLIVPLAYFPRLLSANKKQLENYEISVEEQDYTGMN